MKKRQYITPLAVFEPCEALAAIMNGTMSQKVNDNTGGNMDGSGTTMGEGQGGQGDEGGTWGARPMYGDSDFEFTLDDF